MSKWTSDPPTTAGWYWLRDRAGQMEVVQVEEGPDGDLWVWDGSVAVDEMHLDTVWATIEEPTDAD